MSQELDESLPESSVAETQRLKLANQTLGSGQIPSYGPASGIQGNPGPSRLANWATKLLTDTKSEEQEARLEQRSPDDARKVPHGLARSQSMSSVSLPMTPILRSQFDIQPKSFLPSLPASPTGPAMTTAQLRLEEISWADWEGFMNLGRSLPMVETDFSKEMDEHIAITAGLMGWHFVRKSVLLDPQWKMLSERADQATAALQPVEKIAWIWMLRKTIKVSSPWCSRCQAQCRGA